MDGHAGPDPGDAVTVKWTPVELRSELSSAKLYYSADGTIWQSVAMNDTIDDFSGIGTIAGDRWKLLTTNDPGLSVGKEGGAAFIKGTSTKTGWTSTGMQMNGTLSGSFDLGGIDVLIDPIAWAEWAGLLVTALNLLPAGQLDGGHVIYTLIGKKARRLLPFILIGLFLLGFVWSGCWLWADLIFALGRVYAEPLDQITDLNSSRKVLAVIGLLIFLLVFTPVPLIQTFA